MDFPVATETSSLFANRVDQSLRDVINPKVCRPPSSLTHATTAVLRKASEDIGVIAAINVAKRQEVLLCVQEQLQPPRRLPPLAKELVLPDKLPEDNPWDLYASPFTGFQSQLGKPVETSLWTASKRYLHGSTLFVCAEV